MPIQSPEIPECVTYMNNFSPERLSCPVWTFWHSKKDPIEVLTTLGILRSPPGPALESLQALTSASQMTQLGVCTVCQWWGDSWARELCSASSSQREKRRLSQLVVSLQSVQEGVSVSQGMSLGWILSTWYSIKLRSGQIFFFILYDTPPPTLYFFIHLRKF